jgi:hypothetical protein
MPTVEIRQRKVITIPMLVMTVIALISMLCYAFFSGKYDDNTAMQVIYFIVTCYVMYSLYSPLRKIIRNEFVIKMTDSEIIFYMEFKTTACKWKDITYWAIEKSADDSAPYLVVKASGFETSVGITWLDKTSIEIGALMTEFKARATSKA